MTEWRFIAQRALTGEFLEMELPLSVSSLKWDLSGPGSLTGTVEPDTGVLRAPDGRLLLEEWGTYLYAEADGEIRWGGIVVSSKFDGARYQIEAAGFSTYPHGLPYQSTYSRANIDPAQIIRDIWAHVQSHPDGDLGVQVVGSTKARKGSDSTAKLADATADYNAAKSAYDSANATLKSRRTAETNARKVYSDRVAARTAASKALTAAKKTKNPAQIAAAQAAYNDAVAAVNAQKSVVNSAAAATDAQAAVVADRKAVRDKASDARAAARKAEKADGGAYALNWWDTPDCGDEIDKLAQETPLDYVESHAWNSTRTAISHRVTIHYPRAGRRRTDLRFVLGDNVLDLAAPQIDGDEFANEVVGIGSGEGKGALRRTTAVRDGRLRRTAVLKGKRVAVASRLDAMIRDELRARQGDLQIESVEVVDHPNAPIGAWAIGDDVLIQAELPWLDDVSLWCRITGWELLSESRARLSLARADSFTYGG